MQLESAHLVRYSTGADVGLALRLVAEVSEWLRLARVDRLLDYATPQESDRVAFVERLGFCRLTETAREWRLDA